MEKVPIPPINGPLTNTLMRAFSIIGQNYARNEAIAPHWWDILLKNEAYLNSLEGFLTGLTKQRGPAFCLGALKQIHNVPRTTATSVHAEEFCLTAVSLLGIASGIWMQAASGIVAKHQATFAEEIAKATKH